MTSNLEPSAPRASRFLGTGGGMGALIAAHDWRSTPFGPIEGWPQSLLSSLSICLNSSTPMAIYWGPELRSLYNDAWAQVSNGRHEWALGRPAAEVLPDIWPIVGPQFAEVMRTGIGFSANDQMLPFQRNGHIVETWWDLSLVPIAGEDGGVAGVFNQGQDTSERMTRLARAALMIEFVERIRHETSPVGVIGVGMDLLGPHLGAARVSYVEIDALGAIVPVDRVWIDRTKAWPAEAGFWPAAITAQMIRGEAVVVEDVAADPRITAEDLALCGAQGVGAVLALPVIEQARTTGAFVAYGDRARSWPLQQIGGARRLIDRLVEELGRVRAETALRDSEQRHRLIFEQARDLIFTADLGQRITSANPAAAQAVGATPGAMVGRNLRDFVHPEDQGISDAVFMQKLRNGGTTRYEVRLRQPDVEDRLLEVSSTLSLDRDGRPNGIYGIARDVTERHAFETRQAALIDELNHRVKNTLALVQSLALQSFRNGRDPVDAQAVFQVRLATLAAAHDLLTRAGWEGAGLAELAQAALTVHDDPPGRIDVSGPPVTLTPKAAISLVLVLHELATNAAKYGSLSAAAGKVMLAWSLEDGGLRLDWREEGGPPARAPARRGFGLRLIERALSNDLSADVSVDFTEEGFRLAVRAPQQKVQA